MAEHKFEFIVSGFDLSDETRLHINQEIAAAVSRVVISANPGQFAGVLWGKGRGPINGGRILDMAQFEAAQAASAKAQAG